MRHTLLFLLGMAFISSALAQEWASSETSLSLGSGHPDKVPSSIYQAKQNNILAPPSGKFIVRSMGTVIAGGKGQCTRAG
jgi:hypothetical protein